jgi:hypothetical protein
MKKWMALAACFVFALSATVQAEKPKNTFEVGPEVFYHKYEEPGYMKETGTLYGMVMNLTSHDTWMTALQLELAYGKVNYDGAYQDGTPFKYNGITDWLFDGRALLGPEFNWDGGYCSPYTGIAYRWLRDELSEAGPGGYDRASNYVYLPLGITATFALGDGWSLTPTAEYDILLYGQQISELSDIDPAYSDITNDQTEGYGWRLSLAVEKKFDSWSIKLQPFIRYWDIKQSDIDEQYGAFIEPKNKTTQTGLQAILTF